MIKQKPIEFFQNCGQMNCNNTRHVIDDIIYSTKSNFNFNEFQQSNIFGEESCPLLHNHKETKDAKLFDNLLQEVVSIKQNNDQFYASVDFSTCYRNIRKLIPVNVGTSLVSVCYLKKINRND